MNVDSLHMFKERRRQKDTCATEEERRAMRGALGELNWLSVCSRPDISAASSLLQQRVSTATVADLIEVNRLVAMARDFSTVEVRIKSVPALEAMPAGPMQKARRAQAGT